MGKLQGWAEQGGVLITQQGPPGVQGPPGPPGPPGSTITAILGPPVVSACDFSGVDAAAKIEAAFVRLPASGGTIDCRCFGGTQAFATDPFTGMSTPVTVIMGPATFTSSVNLNMPANVNLIMLDGAIISISAGQTFTISGGLVGSSLSLHFTGAGSVHFQTSQIPEIYPQWWGAKGDGVNDDTLAIQAAYTAAQTFPTGVVVVFPAGTYKTTSTVTTTQNNSGSSQTWNSIYTRGAGARATRWLYAPTANNTVCFHVTRPNAASDSYGGISNIEFFSTDTTFVKTAILLSEVAEFYVDDVSIMGTGGPSGFLSFWSDASNSSIGLQTSGHEGIHVNHFSCYADRPIYISQSFVLPTQALDSSGFENQLLVANQHPCIEVQPNQIIQRIHFGGYNAWVYGTDGFRWLFNPASATTCFMLRFDNCSYEQSQSTTGYGINIQCSGGSTLHDLTIKSCQVDNVSGNGIILRGIRGAMLESFQYTSPHVALDVDSSSTGFIFLNNSFTEVGGQTINNGGLVNFVYYNKQIGVLGINTFNPGGISGGVISLPNALGINADDTTGVSRRLLSLTAANALLIDGDARGSTFNGAVNFQNGISVNVGTTLVGLLSSSAGITVSGGRVQTAQGVTVTAASLITLGQGNVFQISGSTTINNIDTTGWQAGSVIILYFQNAVTLTHAAAGAGPFYLRAAVNLSVTAGTTHTFVLTGGVWAQVD
jgi:hypothetical protein